jgi:type IV secretory pathway TraG/TraD family ATPase VirD4
MLIFNLLGCCKRKKNNIFDRYSSEISKNVVEFNQKVSKYGNKGLRLSRYISISYDRIQTNFNTLVVGNTNSGKTDGYVMKNILNMNGNYVVTTKNGYLYDKLKDLLRMNGYNVYLFSMKREDSIHYNPLLHLVEKDGKINSDLYNLLLDEILPEKEDENVLLTKAKRTIFNYVVKDVLENYPSKTFRQVYDILLTDMDLSKKVFVSEDVFEQAIAEITRALKPYLHERFNADNIEIKFNRLPLQEADRFALFIDLDRDTDEYNGVFNLFVKQLFNVIQNNVNEFYAENPNAMEIALDKLFYMNFILDDFCDMPKIESLGILLSMTRMKFITISIITQGMYQLSNYLGNQLNTILANIGIFILYQSNGRETLEYFSNLFMKNGQDSSLYPLFSMEKLVMLPIDMVGIYFLDNKPVFDKAINID